MLTREALRAESVRGGFSAVYPVLKILEESGRIRRGYAVAGLGAAQFAAPGAIDRLRALREPSGGRDASEAPPEVVVLAATDPAQPYGAALAWPPTPGRPARAAGASVILVGGAAAAVVERGGRSLTTFEDGPDPALWLSALKGLVDERRLRKLEVVKVDGVAVHDSDWAATLAGAGFTAGYRGLTYRGRAPDATARR
ncbi:MAG: hypothetical protein WEB09_06935 [Nitriliruptor sp.]